MGDIKYRVIQMGRKDGAPPGPNGEFGIWFLGEKDGRGTGAGGWCLNVDPAHTHDKACAQTVLDQKPDPMGRSAREIIAAWHAEQDALAARPAENLAPLPKKEVEVVRDGKKIKEKVEDRDLA